MLKSAKVSKQSDKISEIYHKLEQILCHVAAIQKSASLLKVCTFKEVLDVLYKEGSLPNRHIFRFSFLIFIFSKLRVILIKVYFGKFEKARKFPKNAQKNLLELLVKEFVFFFKLQATIFFKLKFYELNFYEYMKRTPSRF